jgi:RTA1 like protein
VTRNLEAACLCALDAAPSGHRVSAGVVIGQFLRIRIRYRTRIQCDRITTPRAKNSANFREADNIDFSINSHGREQLPPNNIMALYPRDDSIAFVFYRYDPTLVGAIIFASLFGASTGLILYQMVRTKTWYFIPFFIGGICKCPLSHISDSVVETLGYVGRTISHFNSTALPPYIMQSLLLLLAPALFAASIYMSFGRLIHFVNGEHHSVIRTDRITKLFVCGDVLSFFIQGTGTHNPISVSYGRG